MPCKTAFHPRDGYNDATSVATGASPWERFVLKYFARTGDFAPQFLPSIYRTLGQSYKIVRLPGTRFATQNKSNIDRGQLRSRLNHVGRMYLTPN